MRDICDHHVHLRQREVRAVGVVVGARRDQLDRVGAEDRQVADVLLPHRHVPRVVGVGLRPVAELVAAKGDLRRRDDGERGGRADRPASSCAVRGAAGRRRRARPGHRLRARGPWRRGAAGGVEDDPVALGAGRLGRRQPAHACAGPARRGGDRADGDGGDGVGRPLRGDRQPHVRALLDFLDEHPNGRPLLEAHVFGVTTTARVRSTHAGSAAPAGGRSRSLRARRAGPRTRRRRAGRRRSGERNAASIRPHGWWRRMTAFERGFISTTSVLFITIRPARPGRAPTEVECRS